MKDSKAMKTILRTYNESGTLCINKTVIKRLIGKGTGGLRAEPITLKEACEYLEKQSGDVAILLNRCLYLLKQKEVSKAILISKRLKDKHQVVITYPANWGSETEVKAISARQKKAIFAVITVLVITTLIIL